MIDLDKLNKNFERMLSNLSKEECKDWFDKWNRAGAYRITTGQEGDE